MAKQVIFAAKNFPVVILTGPRRVGKTFLLRQMFPHAEYFLLEDPDIVSRFRSDPQGFLVPTVSRWMDVLEATGQIMIVHPYFENFGKRIVKSPKVYVLDSGLACHLLGIETATEKR